MKELIALMLVAGWHNKAFLKKQLLRKLVLTCFSLFIMLIMQGQQNERIVKGNISRDDGEPLAGIELLGGPERMTDVNRGSLVRALVLVEKAQLRRDRAGESEQDAQIQRHVSSYVD